MATVSQIPEAAAMVHAAVPGLGDAWIRFPTMYLAHAIARALSKGLDEDVDVFQGSTCTYQYRDGEVFAAVTVQ